MQEIIITAEQFGERLDKFLMREVFCNENISRGEITKEIKNGKVRVNDKSIKPSYVLKEQDRVAISFTIDKNPVGIIPNPKLKIKILENNSNFLIIDKPTGIPVHPAAYEKNNTIVNWLVAKYPKIKTVHDESLDAELRPGIVHRLDRDTSGVMVIAKNQKTFEALKKIFQNRKVKKTYLTLVHGRMEQKSGLIEKPLAKAANYKKQVVASARTKTQIKVAVTGYKVIKEFKEYSLVEAYPKTGRTHQIRIHLWSLGHPVVGDELYKVKGREPEKFSAPRQLLHAEKIEFKLAGRSYAFSSKVSKDFKEFLKKLD